MKGLGSDVCRRFAILILMCLQALGALAQLRAQSPGEIPASDAHSDGFRMLDEAQFEANGLPPLSKVIAALQLAGIRQRDDPRRAKAALVDALAATQALPGDLTARWQVKVRVFLMLLELDPIEAQKHVDQDTAPILSNEQFIKAVALKDFLKALALLDTVSMNPSFPYLQATQLMLALPPEMRDERSLVFAAALKNFKAKDSNRIPQPEDLGTWLVRFSDEVPKPLALESARVLLQDARESDKQTGLRIVLGTSEGQAHFSNVYQLRLFQILPSLKKIDPDWAEALLKENPSLKRALEQYPQGLASLQPSFDRDPANDRPHLVMNYSRGPLANTSAQASGSAQMLVNAAMQKIAELSAKDLDAALRQAKALPISPEAPFSPRASAMAAIFDVQVAKRDRSAARRALAALLDEVKAMPPLQRARYLNASVRHIRTLIDDSAALDVLRLEFETAKELLRDDMNEQDPNLREKPYWPSTVFYQALIYNSGKIDRVMAEGALRQIPDAEVRTFAKIAFAAALLGLPPLKLELMSALHKESGKGFNSMPFMPPR